MFRPGRAEIRPEKIANLIGAQYEKRIEAYSSNVLSMRKHMRAFTDRISEVLGHDYPVSLETPIFKALSASSLFSAFLNQIFVVSFIAIVVLGAILIYALAAAEVSARRRARSISRPRRKYN